MSPSRCLPSRPPCPPFPRRMVLLLALIATVPLASGCATSGALTLISLGASGVSYAATGKSLSDHALSLVLERDCAALRLLEGQAPCRSAPTRVPASDDLPGRASMIGRGGDPEKASRLASLAPPPAGAATDGGRSRGRSAPPPLRVANADTDPDRSGVAVAVQAPFPPLGPTPLAAEGADARSEASEEGPVESPGAGTRAGLGTFLVLGSFGQPENAERFRRLQGEEGGGRLLPIRIVASRVRGAERYRVVAGPLPVAGATKPPLPPLLTGAGGRPWRLALCLPALTPPPCGAPGRGEPAGGVAGATRPGAEALLAGG